MYESTPRWTIFTIKARYIHHPALFFLYLLPSFILFFHLCLLFNHLSIHVPLIHSSIYSVCGFICPPTKPLVFYSCLIHFFIHLRIYLSKYLVTQSSFCLHTYENLFIYTHPTYPQYPPIQPYFNPLPNCLFNHPTSHFTDFFPLTHLVFPLISRIK